MRHPVATYRLQLRPGFGFDEAAKAASYLAALGVSDAYVSPIFAARPQSAHGYDVVDMTAVRSDLGGAEGLERLSAELGRLGLRWLQDIVPNHRAFHIDNVLLVDVLELGPHSRFYDFFDVLWDHQYDNIRGKILAPFLGDFYARCLEKGELVLAYDDGGFRIRYFDHAFPLSLRSYATVLQLDLARRSALQGSASLSRVQALVTFLENLDDEIAARPDFDHAPFIKALLSELYDSDEKVRSHVDGNLRRFNGGSDGPERWDLLDTLLAEQYFRLAYWKVGTEELNYRRFFSVNDLISLRIEEPRVFEHTHSLLFDLVRSGKIHGVRVDHVDGLYDPTEYLRRLREAIPESFVVVEKILHGDERVPESWPIQGTTGYDFLDRANGLFCEVEEQSTIDQVYRAFSGDDVPYAETVRDYKRLIVGRHMAGDIDNLALLLKSITNRSRLGNDLTMYAVRRALVEILAQFPVYRTYVGPSEFSDVDLETFHSVCSKACESAQHFRNELELIRSSIDRLAAGQMSGEERDDWVRFLMRLQQYTSPVMAKGVEDSAFYAYVRLLARNEVGCDPAVVGFSVDEWHSFGRMRAERAPLSLNASATHDTKRGEDARARLAVLSWDPAEWGRRVERWGGQNRRHKTAIGECLAPCRRDEYALYQTLIGSAPHGGFDKDDFPARLAAYLVKASREAKRETSWLNPSPEYEGALCSFAERILDPDQSGEFLADFVPYFERVSMLGTFVSLAQLLLKLTFPGVPDIYQGTELWDLSMVDPDNRRPVDYELRRKALDDIVAREKEDESSLLGSLRNTPQDGRLKLWLLHRVLGVRREHAGLFSEGRYEPLSAVGDRSDNVVAFARVRGDEMAVVITARRFDELDPSVSFAIPPERWGDTTLQLPWLGSSTLHGRLIPSTHDGSEPLTLGTLLGGLPFALLTTHAGKARSAQSSPEDRAHDG